MPNKSLIVIKSFYYVNVWNSVLIGCQATISNNERVKFQCSENLRWKIEQIIIGWVLQSVSQLANCGVGEGFACFGFWCTLAGTLNATIIKFAIQSKPEYFRLDLEILVRPPFCFFSQGWKIVDGSIREIRLDRKICFEIFFGFRTLEIVVTDVSSLGQAFFYSHTLHLH